MSYCANQLLLKVKYHFMFSMLWEWCIPPLIPPHILLLLGYYYFFRAAGMFAWWAPMNLCVCSRVSARLIRGRRGLRHWLPGSPCPNSEVVLLQWNSQGLRPAPGPDQVGTAIAHILRVSFVVRLSLWGGLSFDTASLKPQVSLTLFEKINSQSEHQWICMQII